MEDDKLPPIDWDGLTAPLDPEDIEWLPKGKAYQKSDAAGVRRSFKACVPYLKMQSLRRRLDKYAKGRWSYDVHEIRFSDGQPLPRDTRGELDPEPFYCRGEITIRGDGEHNYITRAAIGSGKNYKEAETDAFKRAGQRLGVGNELYGELEPLEVEVDQYGQPLDAKGAYLRKVDPDAYDMVTHETPLVDPRKPPPMGGIDFAAKLDARPGEPVFDALCPACHGRMWDNRFNKRNPRAPDFKCRDARCEGVWWKLADYEKSLGAEKDDRPLQAQLDDEKDDDLPF